MRSPLLLSLHTHQRYFIGEIFISSQIRPVSGDLRTNKIMLEMIFFLSVILASKILLDSFTGVTSLTDVPRPNELVANVQCIKLGSCDKL